MNLIVKETAEDVSRLAADMIEAEIRGTPGVVILPATGNTPLRTYEIVAERVELGLDVSNVRVFQLDEYVDVAQSDRRSLFGWIDRSFLKPLKIPEDHVTRLRGDVSDLEESCLRYEEAVAAAGGIDLAILGLGLDGHLGYNEPPSLRDSRTRVVRLLTPSRAVAASYWPSDAVPEAGITAGMSTILGARKILLLVTGKAKRDILHQVLEGPIGPDVPASFLRSVPESTIIADREAMAGN